MATVYDTINGYYRQYLGRDATQDEINQQTGYGRAVAPKNLAWAAGQIANSAEAQAYAKRAATPATTTPSATTPTPTTTTGAPNQVTNPSSTSSGSGTSTTGTKTSFTNTGTGGTGHANYSYAGFDFNQNASNRDTGKSAKYAFADATREAADKGVSASTWKMNMGSPGGGGEGPGPLQWAGCCFPRVMPRRGLTT